MKDIIITKADTDLFDLQDNETLAKWYSELNSWKWPKEIDGEDDRYKDRMERSKRGCRKQSHRQALMREIDSRVGQRFLLWVHNRETMTKEEFNDFWNGNYEGDKEARKRYDAAIQKEIDLENAKFDIFFIKMEDDTTACDLLIRNSIYFSSWLDREKKLTTLKILKEFNSKTFLQKNNIKIIEEPKN